MTTDSFLTLLPTEIWDLIFISINRPATHISATTSARSFNNLHPNLFATLLSKLLLEILPYLPREDIFLLRCVSNSLKKRIDDILEKAIRGTQDTPAVTLRFVPTTVLNAVEEPTSENSFLLSADFENYLKTRKNPLLWRSVHAYCIFGRKRTNTESILECLKAYGKHIYHFKLNVRCYKIEHFERCIGMFVNLLPNLSVLHISGEICFLCEEKAQENVRQRQLLNLGELRSLQRLSVRTVDCSRCLEPSIKGFTDVIYWSASYFLYSLQEQVSKLHYLSLHGFDFDDLLQKGFSPTSLKEIDIGPDWGRYMMRWTSQLGCTRIRKVTLRFPPAIIQVNAAHWVALVAMFRVIKETLRDLHVCFPTMPPYEIPFFTSHVTLDLINLQVLRLTNIFIPWNIQGPVKYTLGRLEAIHMFLDNDTAFLQENMQHIPDAGTTNWGVWNLLPNIQSVKISYNDLDNLKQTRVWNI